jgi:hypothetical protein
MPVICIAFLERVFISIYKNVADGFGVRMGGPAKPWSAQRGGGDKR